MANSPLNQSDLNNENIFNEKWEILAEHLFKNKDTIEKNELEEIMKTFPHYYETDNKTIRAFDTHITWNNIYVAFMNDQSLTKEELRIRLKNLFSFEDTPSEQQDTPSEQQDTPNDENIFNEKWGKLVNKLFRNKKTITKKEIERTVRKYNLNPKK